MRVNELVEVMPSRGYLPPAMLDLWKRAHTRILSGKKHTTVTMKTYFVNVYMTGPALRPSLQDSPQTTRCEVRGGIS
jgi:hypothetical protein